MEDKSPGLPDALAVLLLEGGFEDVPGIWTR